MSTKNRPKSKPSIVSIDCSRIKLFPCWRRRHHACSDVAAPLASKAKSCNHSTLRDLIVNSMSTSPLSITNIRNRKIAANAYLKWAQQLEAELNQISRWLEAEQQLRESINPRAVYPSSKLSSQSMLNYDAYSDSTSHSSSAMVQETEINIDRALMDLDYDMIRLIEGNYLYKMESKFPSRKLIMQFSGPALVSTETGSTITEILHCMASLGATKLYSCLNQLIPLVDIQNHIEDIKGKPVTQGDTKGFLEEILVYAMNRIEDLVIEGLRVQIGITGEAQREKLKTRTANYDRVNVISLVQLRDPDQEYEAIGDFMIMLIEAYTETGNEFWINSINIAGLKAFEGGKSENTGDDARDFHRLLRTSVRTSRPRLILLWSICKTVEDECGSRLFRRKDIICTDEY